MKSKKYLVGALTVLLIANQGAAGESTPFSPRAAISSFFESFGKPAFTPVLESRNVPLEVTLMAVEARAIPQTKIPVDDVTTAELVRASEGYASEMQRIKEAAGLLKGVTYGVAITLEAALEAESAKQGRSRGSGRQSVGQKLAARAAVTSMAAAMNAGVDAYETERRKSAEALLHHHTQRLSREEISEWNSLLKEPPEQAKKKAEQLVAKWTKNFVPSTLSSEDQATAHGVMNGFIARVALTELAKERSIQRVKSQQIEANVDKLGKNIYSISMALDTHAKSTAKALVTISRSQQQIASSLSKMADRVSRQGEEIQVIKNDVAFMKDVLFSQMSPAEQIAAFKAGVWGDPNGAENQDMKEKMAILEGRVEFNKAYEKIVGGAQDLVQIGRNLGVDPKLLNDVQKGVDTVQHGRQAFTALANGNFIGAALAVTNIFGKSQDIGETRHNQVMDGLKALLAGQAVMDAKLDKILDNQRAQTELLAKISLQIRDSTDFLYENMQVLSRDILGNRVLLADLVTRDFKHCESAVIILRKEGWKNALTENPSFRRHVSNCSDAYGITFIPRDYASRFSFETFKSSKNKDAISSEVEAYERLLGYMQSRKVNQYVAMVSGLNPSAHFLGMRKKSERLYRFLNEEGGRPATEFWARMNQRLLPTVVLKNVSHLIEILPSVIVVNKSLHRDSMQLSAILKVAPTAGLHEMQFVDGAIELVNLSIAQETLMAGDPILSVFYDDPQTYEQGVDCKAPEKLLHPACILNLNSRLATNFVSYMLYRNLREQGFSPTLYGDFWRANDPEGLQRYLTKKLNVLKSNDGKAMVVKFLDRPIAMPAPDAVIDGRIAFSEALPSLLELRYRLLDLKTEMQMNKTLPVDIRNIIYKTTVGPLARELKN